MSASQAAVLGPDDIIAILQEDRATLESYGVKKIGLFGSFARREQTPSSDVDFLVELETPDFDNFMDLAFYLEERLGRRVELVTRGNLSPYVAPLIEQEVIWHEI